MTSRALCTCLLCICCKGEISWRPPSGIGGSGGALHLSFISWPRALSNSHHNATMWVSPASGETNDAAPPLHGGAGITLCNVIKESLPQFPCTPGVEGLARRARLRQMVARGWSA
jgi:hypothetical protein